MNVNNTDTTLNEWYELIEINFIENGYILIFNEK